MLDVLMFVIIALTILLGAAIVGSWIVFLIALFQGKPETLTLEEILNEWIKK